MGFLEIVVQEMRDYSDTSTQEMNDMAVERVGRFSVHGYLSGRQKGEDACFEGSQRRA